MATEQALREWQWRYVAEVVRQRPDFKVFETEKGLLVRGERAGVQSCIAPESTLMHPESDATRACLRIERGEEWDRIAALWLAA